MAAHPPRSARPQAPRGPRPGPAAAAALLLLAALLAGCTAAPPQQPSTGTQDPGPDAGPRAGLVPTGEAANATQPDDQSDFARSLDEKFHTHNYWGGSLEKLLMDQDVASADLVPAEPFDAFVTAFRLVRAGGLGGTSFGLPEGSIVPPEAVRLEVAVTWASSPTITGLRLGYSTAASENVTTLDPLPDGGATVAIPTTLADNDIPHTSVSKWRFHLVPHNDAAPGAPGVFNGTVRVAIKAFREDTLFVAPPHPDFWGANTTLPLFNVSGAIRANSVVFPVNVQVAEDDPGAFVFVVPPPGAIVPPHTGVLTLILEWQNNATLPNPFGSSLDLLYSAADSRQFHEPGGRQVEEGRATFTVAVTPAMADSPYANQSAWSFVVLTRTDSPTRNLLGFGDVGFFDGTFTLTAIAEREA